MNNTYTLGIAFSALALTLAGCSPNSITPSQAGEVKIEEYCTGDKYNTDSKHFRSTATGQMLRTVSLVLFQQLLK
jgi:hypothetical protein